MDILYNILNIAKSNGINEQGICKILDLSRSGVYNWKKGQGEISAKHVATLAKHFNVSADYLLGLTDISQRNGTELTGDEEQLINDYRNLNEQGQELTRQIMHSTLNTYKKRDDFSKLETS